MTNQSENIENKSSMTPVAQAKWAVCLGLSLTAIMATVLFMTVYFNPKDESYGSLPLFYAGISAVVAFAMNRLAVYFERQSQVEC